MSELKPRAPRQDIDFTVALAFESPAVRSVGAFKNISSSGMLVESPERRPPGSPVSFESIPASGAAEVVWARESEGGRVLLGMRFVRLTRSRQEDLTSHAMEGNRARGRKGGGRASRTSFSFREVTDVLLRHRVSIAEIAFSLGSSVESVRLARDEPDRVDDADLPDDWQSLLGELARGRGPILDELASELSGWR